MRRSSALASALSGCPAWISAKLIGRFASRFVHGVEAGAVPQ